MSRHTIFLAAALPLVVVLALACGQPQPEPAAEEAAGTTAGEPATFVFRGRVEAVDPSAKTLTVFNENVEGWMPPMSMIYAADSDDVYATVKPGDVITATVHEADFKTLYGVRVIDEPEAAPSTPQGN